MSENPAAVLSVAFLRREPEPQVLVAVRAQETNPRHPGVVSVPTMRIPLALADQLTRGEIPEDGGYLDLLGPYHTFGTAGAGTSIEGLLVESILSKKIISGSMLESGEIQGTCSVRCVSKADVDDPTGRDGAIEPTLMVTIVAECEKGGKRLEGNSASYSQITWIDRQDLMTSWQRRDAQFLFPDANPFEICIRGLCVSSAVHVLSRDLSMTLKKTDADLG
ncbi:hypothetical protein [Streptomyces sp. NBC_00986]|uniref:hypothetical protein n=1 Tax=Streptomyces sp. NBC_00986 TaxID=2903702 RepID=UPI003867686D|nr:hypothetical protein OG504_25955 [Streptomyces sp. NBC_00986]